MDVTPPVSTTPMWLSPDGRHTWDGTAWHPLDEPLWRGSEYAAACPPGWQPVTPAALGEKLRVGLAVEAVLAGPDRTLVTVSKSASTSPAQELALKEDAGFRVETREGGMLGGTPSLTLHATPDGTRRLWRGYEAIVVDRPPDRRIMVRVDLASPEGNPPEVDAAWRLIQASWRWVVPAVAVGRDYIAALPSGWFPWLPLPPTSPGGVENEFLIANAAVPGFEAAVRRAPSVGTSRTLPQLGSWVAQQRHLTVVGMEPVGLGGVEAVLVHCADAAGPSWFVLCYRGRSVHEIRVMPRRHDVPTEVQTLVPQIAAQWIWTAPPMR